MPLTEVLLQKWKNKLHKVKQRAPTHTHTYQSVSTKTGRKAIANPESEANFSVTELTTKEMLKAAQEKTQGHLFPFPCRPVTCCPSKQQKIRDWKQCGTRNQEIRHRRGDEWFPEKPKTIFGPRSMTSVCGGRESTKEDLLEERNAVTTWL